MLLKIGDLVRYCERVYEVGNTKSNARGYWVQLSSEPSSASASAMTGIMQEAWFPVETMVASEME